MKLTKLIDISFQLIRYIINLIGRIDELESYFDGNFIR